MTQPDGQVFDIDAAFDGAGSGSGAPSFKWPKHEDPTGADRKVPIIGGSIVGVITDIYATVVKDPEKKDSDGNPLPKLDRRGRQQPQFNLTLQTSLRNWEGVVNVPTAEDGVTPLPASDDTGERRIYVKYKLLEAIAKAIQASEQGKGGPKIGAKLGVKVKDLIYSSDKMRHPLPDYEAQYWPPVESFGDDAFDSAAAGPAGSEPAGSAPASDEPPF